MTKIRLALIGLLFLVNSASAADLVRPTWRAGDTWVVETRTRGFAGPVTEPGRLLWTFRVGNMVRLDGETCWQLTARSEHAGDVTLWCSASTGGLRKVRVSLPTARGPRVFEEEYGTPSGNGPVLPLLTALPCDLPDFTVGRAKGDEPGEFVTGGGNDRVSFLVPVVQKRPGTRGQAKGGETSPFVEKLDGREVATVRLESEHRAVLQDWHPDAPWPLYSSDGVTTSRLIDFTPATDRPDGNTRWPDDPREPPARGTAKNTSPGPIQDSAEADILPWSGHWWPHRQGGLRQPLLKYDRFTGSSAAEWEAANHPPDRADAWHGHCHAWAAASVSDPEPNQVRRLSVEFSVGDQKGLLAALHANDVANFWGDRFGDGEGGDDPADLAPDQLWHLLQAHLGRHKISLLVDAENGPEVWNYPVLRYRVVGDDLGGGRHACEMKLWMADMNVPPDFVGTRIIGRSYRFEVEIRDGRIVLGTGRWLGTSLRDHPDFAWYPLAARAENPHVRPDRVAEIVGGHRPDSPEPTTPPTAETLDLILSPEELLALVTDRTSSWAFDLTVDHADGGVYDPGEPLEVRVRSEKGGYLYLFHIDPDGGLRLCHPSSGKPERVNAGQRFTWSGGGLLRGAAAGKHHIVGVVTERPVVPFSLNWGRQGQTWETQPPRLPPGQERARREALRDYRRGESRPDVDLMRLGRFALDSCLFHVRPRAGDGPGGN